MPPVECRFTRTWTAAKENDIKRTGLFKRPWSCEPSVRRRNGTLVFVWPRISHSLAFVDLSASSWRIAAGSNDLVNGLGASPRKYSSGVWNCNPTLAAKFLNPFSIFHATVGKFRKFNVPITAGEVLCSGSRCSATSCITDEERVV